MADNIHYLPAGIVLTSLTKSENLAAAAAAVTCRPRIPVAY